MKNTPRPPALSIWAPADIPGIDQRKNGVAPSSFPWNPRSIVFCPLHTVPRIDSYERDQGPLPVSIGYPHRRLPSRRAMPHPKNDRHPHSGADRPPVHHAGGEPPLLDRLHRRLVERRMVSLQGPHFRNAALHPCQPQHPRIDWPGLMHRLRRHPQLIRFVCGRSQKYQRTCRLAATGWFSRRAGENCQWRSAAEASLAKRRSESSGAKPRPRAQEQPSDPASARKR